MDEQSKPFVTMTHDKASKNHPGGLHDKPSHEKSAPMYETDSKTDGYKAIPVKMQPQMWSFVSVPLSWLERITTCSRPNVENKYCFAKPLFREQVVFSLVYELWTANGGSNQVRNLTLVTNLTVEWFSQ